MEALSLLELNSLVKRSLANCLPGEYWIQAELSEVNINANGHCYLEFIQKEPGKGRMVAKARGTVWAYIFGVLKPYFEETTGQAFVPGIKVQVKVTVEFHELYGYSLAVHDIDPAYTVGDMALRRREILKQLEEEGVLTLNRELEIPLLPQRIAVISSETAAGYGDFKHQLTTNPRGYFFYIELFAAAMQGNQAESSILTALDHILERKEQFDIVVIIRGGGATSDLSAFDTYLLAAACAQFPLPIITGIGHERDETVLDAVSHTRVKTPTAAAGFLIQHADEAASRLFLLRGQMKQLAASKLTRERQRLTACSARIPVLVAGRLSEARHNLSALRKDMKQAVSSSLTRQRHKLEMLSQRVADASPEHLLKRGYSITLKNGKAVTSPEEVKPGDVLVTKVNKGELTSVVTG